MGLMSWTLAAWEGLGGLKVWGRLTEGHRGPLFPSCIPLCCWGPLDYDTIRLVKTGFGL